MKDDKDPKKLHILVADGSDNMRKLIKSALKKGYPDSLVHEAVNGLEVQSMLEEDDYDVVLCDWEIPGVPCDTVLKWVRSHPSPSVHKIFFIIVSSKHDNVIEAVKSGANSFIVKPFTPSSLIQKVASVLSRRLHKRHSAPGTVTLHFREQNITGRLINIGVGGLLASFSHGPVPSLTEKIIADLELQERKVSDLDCVILRLDEPKSYMSARKIAIRFNTKIQKIYFSEN